MHLPWLAANVTPLLLIGTSYLPLRVTMVMAILYDPLQGLLHQTIWGLVGFFLLGRSPDMLASLAPSTERIRYCINSWEMIHSLIIPWIRSFSLVRFSLYLLEDKFGWYVWILMYAHRTTNFDKLLSVFFSRPRMLGVGTRQETPSPLFFFFSFSASSQCFVSKPRDSSFYIYIYLDYRCLFFFLKEMLKGTIWSTGLAWCNHCNQQSRWSIIVICWTLIKLSYLILSWSFNIGIIWWLDIRFCTSKWYFHVYSCYPL